MLEDAVYIDSLDCSFILKRARFFLGDRWITIGDIKVRNNQLISEVDMPDIEGFLMQREYLDDGTFDWLEWGPRVN